MDLKRRESFEDSLVVVHADAFGEVADCGVLQQRGEDDDEARPQVDVDRLHVRDLNRTVVSSH